FDDPVVLKTGARIQATLVDAVKGEARVGHLDGQGGRGGMRVAITGTRAPDNGDVGLRHRLRVERQRRLHPYDPARRQDGRQAVGDHSDGGDVVTTLRLGNDQLAANELDGLAREHAEVDEPL